MRSGPETSSRRAIRSASRTRTCTRRCRCRTRPPAVGARRAVVGHVLGAARGVPPSDPREDPVRPLLVEVEVEVRAARPAQAAAVRADVVEVYVCRPPTRSYRSATRWTRSAARRTWAEAAAAPGGGGGGGGGVEPNSEYSRRLGDPVPGLVTLPVVAQLSIAPRPSPASPSGALQVQRRGARDVRRRHRRAADRVRRRVRRVPRRGDARARARTGPGRCRSWRTTRARRCASSRRPSARSGTRAGEELQALALSLPAATRVGHAVGDRVAHRGVERRRRAAAEAHVRDRRLPGRVVGRHPVDAGDDARVDAAAVAVEHAHGDERDALGDAVRRAADGPGDVRAVAVAVVGRCRRRSRRSRTSRGRRTRVREADAGVDDVGLHARAGGV